MDFSVEAPEKVGNRMNELVMVSGCKEGMASRKTGFQGKLEALFCHTQKMSKRYHRQLWHWNVKERNCSGSPQEGKPSFLSQEGISRLSCENGQLKLDEHKLCELIHLVVFGFGESKVK